MLCSAVYAGHHHLLLPNRDSDNPPSFRRLAVFAPHAVAIREHSLPSRPCYALSNQLIN